jgi:hypothetical protein
MAADGILEPSREQLQNLGQSLVQDDPEQFCRDVLANAGFVPGNDILLDGIRHVDIQRHVAMIVKPSTAVLIHLAAEDDVVVKRVEQRGSSKQEFLRANSHPVEKDLYQSLPDMADFIVDAGAPLQDVLLNCLMVLGESGVDRDIIQAARAHVINVT